MNTSDNVPKNAIDAIHALGRFSGAPGLHRIRALCAALDNPQSGLKFVHIAGTNGKGSTACMLASVLRRAGYHTGMYTSPYLTQFYERIRVDGAQITHDALERLWQRVDAAVRTLTLPEGETIGEFECTTALAFLYFAEQGCDIVVLETGLGGRYDATNVIDAPEVCVITPVSRDHTEVLGNSLAEIAGEKAGIIKRGSTVVITPGQPDEARAVLERTCAEQGAKLYEAADSLRVLRCEITGSSFVFEGQGYTLKMAGRHQIQNAQGVLMAVEALRARRLAIPVDAAVRGLATARMAGRLECVRETPLVLLDGAHNPAGADALCAAVDELLKMRRLHIVMGMVRDKEFQPCVQALARRADVFYACAPSGTDRALGAQVLAALAEQDCAEVYDCGDVAAALALALEHAAPRDCVIVCGSLFLIGEAEKILHARQKTAE